ncbi:MAG: hypothetical protein M1495_13520 [Bacteroidetes bacterium]|nr:hypothetical protein [Bacteroidota bacterium]MCL6100147.1 hypothetical protein [Bacteroidota bacterium]
MNIQRIIVIIFIVVALLVAGYFAVGIYQSNQQDSNRNRIISTLYEIGNNVQQYHEKSSGQGGSSSSYTNWILPDKYRKTPDGTFNFVAKRNMVNLSGVGTLIGRNGITNVRAIAKVDSSGIRITIIN